MSTKQSIKNRVVEKLLRNNVIGKHTLPVEAVANRYVSAHEVGDARSLIEDEMIPKAHAGIERVGGGERNTIRIGDVDEAVSFLKENGGNVPAGFGDDLTIIR